MWLKWKGEKHYQQIFVIVSSNFELVPSHSSSSSLSEMNNGLLEIENNDSLEIAVNQEYFQHLPQVRGGEKRDPT